MTLADKLLATLDALGGLALSLLLPFLLARLRAHRTRRRKAKREAEEPP